jgi:FkbM family methyltransferase
MKRLLERVIIKLAKYLNVNLLQQAHVQIGVGHNTYLSGEQFVIDVILEKILKKEPVVIFDVGANIGDYAKMLRNKFKTTDLYCFEPILENFEKLKLNTEDFNIKYENVAVGSTNDVINLYKGSNDADGAMVTAYKDTLTEIFSFAGQPDQPINCKLITIDSFCEGKIEVIDFLKIDVEGHELEVLKGAVKMINNNKISIIQFEFNEFNIFSKTFFYDYYKILKEYKLYRIMPQNKLLFMGAYNSSHEIFRYQNILAVHNSLNYTYE